MSVIELKGVPVSPLIFHDSAPLKDDDDDVERLPLDESKALHLEYPEAAMAAGQEPTGPAACAEKKIVSKSGLKGWISKIFNIHKKDIPKGQFGLFVQNYPLLNKYAEGICNTPELAAISFGDTGDSKDAVYLPEIFGMWAGGVCKVNLGKLLALYASGVLRGKPCTACGSSETLIYRNAGSMLSGKTFVTASVCLECQKVRRNFQFDSHIVLASCKYDHTSPFRPTKTSWTMSALIHALKALELEEQK